MYCFVSSATLLFQRRLTGWNWANMYTIEIQSEILSQCESCIIYNLSLMIFALLSFQIANSLSPILTVFTSSSLLLFGRFSFSFTIRFKVRTSGFKLNRYYNYNKTDSSIMFKLLLYSFGEKSWARKCVRVSLLNYWKTRPLTLMTQSFRHELWNKRTDLSSPLSDDNSNAERL